MITIITSCIKRELYLVRLLNSIRSVGAWDKIEFEHFIVYQGGEPSDKLRAFIKDLPFANKIVFGTTKKVESVCDVMHSCVTRAKYPIIFKIDDDRTLLSNDFLLRAYELCIKMPQALIYPVSVDGRGYYDDDVRRRQTVFLERSNVYITVGGHNAVRGSYLVPLDTIKQTPLLGGGQTDPQIMVVHTLKHHLPCFQCMDGLIIETQETDSGQHHRKQNPDGQIW